MKKLAFMLLAMSAIAGCGKKDEAVLEDVIRPVKMVQLQSGGLNNEVELPGQIFPARQADLAFEVPGLMTEILVEEGQKVSKGEVLAKLDPRDYEASKSAAAAQLQVAELEAQRAEGLYARQATSKQRLDMAVSNLKVAQASYDRAAKAYEDTFLKSPISGVVAKVFVEDVVNVGAKQTILVVQDLRRLKVIVDVPETLGVMAEPGLTLEERNARVRPRVFLTAIPDRSFPAEIAEVSSLADPATRTYEGTLLFDPPTDLNILPGMTAKLLVNLDDEPEVKKDVYAVPSQAVVAAEDGSSFVWVFDQSTSTVKRQGVATGELENDSIEVLSPGLKNGDWVATSGVQVLEEGDTVIRYEN